MTNYGTECWGRGWYVHACVSSIFYLLVGKKLQGHCFIRGDITCEIVGKF